MRRHANKKKRPKTHEAGLPAKLARPSARNSLVRERLHRFLKNQEKRVVWIGASAGPGKTTLIANYLARVR